MTVSLNARQDIYEYLKSGGWITNEKARLMFGCCSISSVIRDLQRGTPTRHAMRIKMTKDDNVHNNGKHGVWRMKKAGE